MFISGRVPVVEPLALILEPVGALADPEPTPLVVLPLAHVRLRHVGVQHLVLQHHHSRIEASRHGSNRA